ncbi:unnamed protein product [Periconia digitata]|uniref:Uncharacterized protein n=1 Tax=Periconia digitata TaxID=1303443 RepID=A0A9W4UTB6_9PLEO|nr:unnamed protein product [Periconia digitata]
MPTINSKLDVDNSTIAASTNPRYAPRMTPLSGWMPSSKHFRDFVSTCTSMRASVGGQARNIARVGQPGHSQSRGEINAAQAYPVIRSICPTQFSAGEYAVSTVLLCCSSCPQGVGGRPDLRHSFLVAVRMRS